MMCVVPFSNYVYVFITNFKSIGLIFDVNIVVQKINLDTIIFILLLVNQ
jgi:hypothetical protein